MPWKLVAVAAVGLAAVLGVAYLGVAEKTYTVRAYFVNAERVVAQNDVTVGGQVAGKVTDVSLVPDGQLSQGGAVITMQIDPRFAPLHQGTRAAIRPKGLLGDMFIDLTPGGNANPEIASGGVIPLHDTSAPVMLDEVQDVFDPQTRYWLKILTLEGGKTFAQNRGQDLNALLAQLPGISANTSGVTGTLAARDQQLDQLDVEFDQIAYEMASEDQALRGDIGSGGAILNTVAAHDQQLQAELVYANRSLGQLNGSLNGHQQDLNQTLKDSPALLADLQMFEQQSTGTLSTIYPCMNDILLTLAEMQSATDYSHTAGSSDGLGDMLRVYPVLQGPENGSYTPGAAQCKGVAAP
jgi:phospholipid/cholesterol/gamma-HCH transport system substrate-binding protein